MISENYAKKFCSEDISKIENYIEATSDTTQTWDCHHRAETDENKTRKELVAEGRYWNVSAKDLIFLTHAEHTSLHGYNRSKELQQKMNEARKGKHRSAETRKKISEAHKGITSWNKGKNLSEEHRQKIREALKGKRLPEETRRKLSEARKGYHWYSNGIQSIQAKECPGPEWNPGYIRKEKYYDS